MRIQGIGEHGGSVISDTTTTTPSGGATSFQALLVLSEAVVDEVAGNLTLDGLTLPAGIFIEGRWTSVKLTSGTIIAYNHPN
jgi:hypothetical protein